ncbi:glycerophosphodiester phosphodiesterase family protein [Brevundimonas goettingensis]|uniref:Glycerophosphodiester phosphodiesterase family protein n=1 Tax=Brevundimonas goettingensis TaxID=2774190 RepID=A0A975C269_9CAUL|nr:glycerophosphodiester phosphodiesterase family protein [Brevundimonas goettingensis]QTC92503.1 glycerophosphodiester phosphodiesterase family protein [Brevundimonas goettingensis]
MIRSLFAAAAVAALLTGCAATPRAGSSEPHLAAWFDCVRDGGIVISAHRGQSADDQPENSLAAIRATGRAIPNAIVEIDAVLTSDGKLTLMHDDTMDRTTTGHGKVAELTLAEVKAARLRAPDGHLTDEAPPTLAEALAAAGEVQGIASIDLKPASEAATLTLARAVIDEVRRVGAADRVILITYSPETARAVADMAPEMMISAGVKSVAELDGLRRPHILAWTGAGRPNPALWAEMKAVGVEAQFGTLGGSDRALDRVYAADGDVSEYRGLFDQGVTVIATDTPLAVKSVLGAEVAKAETCKR